MLLSHCPRGPTPLGLLSPSVVVVPTLWKSLYPSSGTIIHRLDPEFDTGPSVVPEVGPSLVPPVGHRRRLEDRCLFPVCVPLIKCLCPVLCFRYSRFRLTCPSFTFITTLPVFILQPYINTVGPSSDVVSHTFPRTFSRTTRPGRVHGFGTPGSYGGAETRGRDPSGFRTRGI